MPRCRFCCCCCICGQKEVDTDTDDETTELESRAQAASPAKYGASQSSSQQPPLQDENMPPQLPARKYKLKQDENRVGSAPSQSTASSNKITSTGRVNKNIEVLHDRHENLMDVDDAISDLESEAGIYSSLSAQLREKYQRKAESNDQSDPPKKKKKRFKRVRRWWHKHFY